MNPNRQRRSLNEDRLTQRRHKPDYWLLLLSVGLLLIGLIVVYAIGPGLSVLKNVSENYYVGKQVIAILLGAVAFAVTAHLPVNTWRHIEKPLIIITASAAVIVRIFGEQVNGAYRWIQVGGLSFQVAELIKFTLLIWLAGFLVNRIKDGSFNDWHKTLKPLLGVFVLLGFVVAGLESDLGSFGVMLAIMASMVFVTGLPLKRVAMVAAVVAAALVLFVASSPYRRDRLNTFLNPAQDCQNEGYQTCQALISVGSGGLFGLGLARSVQAYGYLPQAADDSIFAILAEKFGFVGVSVILLIFGALFARLKMIIEHAPDNYTRLIVTGILAWLSTQLIINVGAMIGLLPLKGITLPFISYGGTSLVFIMAAVGLAFQISRYTTYGVSDYSLNSTQGNNNDNSANRRRFRGAYNPHTSGRR